MEGEGRGFYDSSSHSSSPLFAPAAFSSSLPPPC
jgi:hypothetical protein